MIMKHAINGKSTGDNKQCWVPSSGAQGFSNSCNTFTRARPSGGARQPNGVSCTNALSAGSSMPASGAACAATAAAVCKEVVWTTSLKP